MISNLTAVLLDFITVSVPCEQCPEEGKKQLPKKTKLFGRFAGEQRVGGVRLL
jgi:hypothetical protein